MEEKTIELPGLLLLGTEAIAIPILAGIGAAVIATTIGVGTYTLTKIIITRISNRKVMKRIEILNEEIEILNKEIEARENEGAE